MKKVKDKKLNKKSKGFFKAFLKVLKRVVCFFIILGLLGVVATVAINGIVILSTKKYILTVDEASELSDVDCVLVLGCAVYGKTLSPMLEDRVLQGIELYNNGVSPKMLMSGDHMENNYDEVNNMKAYAIEKGVPADKIFLDHAGFSSYESMYRAKEVFECKKVVIVTQGYHLYRCVYIARQLGIDAYGVASDLRVYDSHTNSYNNSREFLARIKDFFMCIVKPEPSYLGDVIPISGSAELSDDRDYTTTEVQVNN